MKKIISLFLTLCMVLSLGAVAIVPASADTTYETYAQETIQGGAVLHCFDWSYNNIKAALPDIARAGYTAVQTSPVQAPKDYNSSWTDAVNQWWKLYQPLGFSVANNNNSWLGTKAQLTSLCTEADKYGIKVIVDVVANHVANNGTDGGTYSYINSSVESRLKNAYFYHTNNVRTNDDSRYNITQYHLGMPDLNTGNTTLQQYISGFLEECIDCGVDGFRFDAAKHIELPTDASNFRSNFWPNVLGAATSYAEEKGVDAPFYYGEILGSAGPDFPISNYTTYMAVTDNQTGDRALDKAYWSAASELADGSYMKGSDADKSVLWVESHDTYMGNSGSAYFSNTKSVTSEVLNKAWAIVGARADSTALFFARPNDTMGAASTDTNWKSAAVAEVNKFKNHFEGTSEYLASSGNTAYIERGNKGVVISKLDGGGSVNLTANQMKSGTYTDQVSGGTFTVANGKISGTVGSTGVAVVYNAYDSAFDYITASTLYLRPSPAWIQSGDRYAMYLYNSLDGANAWASMTSAGNNYYSASVPTGDWTNVIFCRMDGSTSVNNWDNKKDQTDDLSPDNGTNLYNVASDKWSVYGASDPTSSTTAPTSAPTSAPTVEPTSATSDTYTVYAADKNGWSKMNVYYWGSSMSSVNWPGTAMSQGGTVFKGQIPSDATGVVFNNGSDQTANIQSGIQNNAQWVVTTTTDGDGKYLAESGPTYYLVGSMNGWAQQSGNKLTLSPSSDGKVQYKLSSVSLSAGAEIKVNDDHNGWYPDGNNYTVQTAGTYDIYFRPNADGDSTWYKKTFRLENVSQYTVTWKNYDGTVLDTNTVPYGTTPEYSGETPARESAAQYDYTFSGWSPAPAAVTSDVEYTAQFTQTPRTFTVTWKNWDGSELEVDEGVAYGARPSYNSDTPTRQSEGSTTYHFSGWAPEITDQTVITEDTTYIARFETNTQSYIITWKDGDGNVLKTESCIQGVTPHYFGDVPTKTATDQYSYTFNNTWDPPVVAADRDTVYTAQFDATVNKYNVTFKNYDGTVLQSSEVEYGTVPEYTADTPVKPSTLTASYIFSGWDKNVVAVTGEAEYTAAFTETAVNTIDISVTNVVGWNNVYVYYWLGNSNNTLPGVAMTGDTDKFIYTASIPENVDGLIFTNGASSGTLQTVDIMSGIEDGAHWAVLNEKDEVSTDKYVVNPVPTYYLVGTMTGWSTDNAPVFTPHKASLKVEEYLLSGVSLSKNAGIKVYGSNNVWYPSGSDNNYNVSADGTYDVYFRPNADGGSTWYNNVFILDNVTQYTVTWKDGDGEILKTEQLTYGETPVYDGPTPTKTATAQYTYSFNGTWSPEITVVNGDAVYTAQFDSTEILPEVAGYTISLKDEIGINFYLNIPDYIDRDLAVVTFTWGTGGYNKTAVTKLVSPANKAAAANCMATCFVTARSMTDVVMMTVTDEYGNVIITDSYRVVDYADQAAAQFGNKKDLLKLLCDMLDYGSAAQIQFGYKSEGVDADLAGDYISAVDENWQRTTDAAAPVDETDITDLDSSKFGIEFSGATLSADSAVIIRLFFLVTDEDLFEGTTACLGDTALEFKDSNTAGYKYIEISGIVAKKIFDVNNITFSNNSGTEYVSEHKYSAANYYNSVISGNYSDSFKDVMKAMYNYSLSAKNIL